MKPSAHATAAFPTMIASLPENPARISSRFSEKLEQLSWAENQTALLLPKAKKLAGDTKLKAAINTLMLSVEERRERLKKVYGAVKGKLYEEEHLAPYHEFRLLISDFDAVTDTEDKAMRDVAVICEIQKMVQFKIEQYSFLYELAEAYNNKQVSGLTEKMLQAEICCDAALMELSVNYIDCDMDELSDFSDNEA